jgi:uncharacterized membrane protein YfcA
MGAISLRMTPAQIGLLVGSSVAAGAINSVAGGGSFFTFPALIFTGVPSIVANATSTMAIWPGSLASISGYREDIRRERHRLPGLLAMSVLGGLLGAFVLLRTPQHTFDQLLPWLLLVATLIFAFGASASQWVRQHAVRSGRATPVLIVTWLIQLLIACYGGYFGAGVGFLMLALLSFAGMTDIHAMNGIKSFLGSTLNGMAIVAFCFAHLILWPQALLMMGGAFVGGYSGARIARRTSPRVIRALVIGIGITLTIYFFMRSR